jgi:predicted component of type VI protein secretion system
MIPTPLTPGLFDLLLPPPEGQSGMARDLEVLLNTNGRTLKADRPQAHDTTGDGYGTLALNGFDLWPIDRERERLARHIEEQLRRFERRLDEPEVTVHADGTIHIRGWVAVQVMDRVQGQPRTKTKRKAVAFTAEREARGYSVRETRSS